MLLSGTGEPDGNYFSADTVEPYYFADTLFKDDGPDLGIFEKKSLSTFRKNNLKFWRDLDEDAAR